MNNKHLSNIVSEACHPSDSHRAGGGSSPIASRHFKATPRRTRLVIIEDGVVALDKFPALSECEETVMVRQAALGDSVTTGVIERIDLLERSSRSIASAVVVLASRLDAPAIANRRELVCSLLRRFQGAGKPEPAEIVLVVDGDASIELRQSLMSLMEELLGLLRGRSVLIRILFGKVSEDDDTEDAWRSAS